MTAPHEKHSSVWVRSVTARAIAPFLAAVFFSCATASGSGSIGAVLKRDTASGAVVAFEVPDGMSAAVAGLRQGDRIKMVDGVHVDDLDGARLVRLLRGPIGTPVVLTVIRGNEVLHLSVVRQGAMPRVAPVPKEEKIE